MSGDLSQTSAGNIVCAHCGAVCGSAYSYRRPDGTFGWRCSACASPGPDVTDAQLATLVAALREIVRDWRFMTPEQVCEIAQNALEKAGQQKE
jgi:hypothetical protein